MMRNNGSRWKLAVAIAMMVSGLAIASDSGRVSRALDRGGEHFPWPFDSLNRKVELADGEYYILAGTIVIAHPQGDPTRLQAYLEVDLNTHPWLASKKRQEYPYYPLDGNLAKWRQYEDSRVRINCQALQGKQGIHLRLVDDGSGDELSVLE